jgi:hypothetical protein
MSTSVTRTDEEQVELFKRAMSGNDMWNIFVTKDYPEESLNGQNGRAKYAQLDWDSPMTLRQAAITIEYFTRNGVEYKIDDYIPLEKQDTVKELIAEFNRLEKSHLTPRSHLSW